MKDRIKKLITANKYTLAEMLCEGQDISLAKCLQETDSLKAYIKHKLQGKHKEYCVKFAVFCAELVLPVWVEKYPTDDRPAKALKAAKVWIKNPTEQNAAAADTAADAAYAAAAAAYAAADAAAYADAYAAAHAAAYAADAYGNNYLEKIVKYLNE